jgi:leucine dehydrogenase
MKTAHELLAEYQPEEVHYWRDPHTDLQAIVVIHSTALGPATGGTRCMSYPNWEAALEDALRLAKAMAYKCAAAGLDFGGGKAVILGDPQKEKTPEKLRAYGKFIERFQGRFTTGQDVGINSDDLSIMAQETRFIAGTRGIVNDLALVTAHGVLYGIKACCQVVYGNDSLQGRRIAVQGAGKVGYRLIERLHQEGAELWVSDIDRRSLERVQREFDVRLVEPMEIYAVECDIFSPCALGEVLNDRTLPLLNCKIVAGSANNPLKEARHGDRLHEFGILYAPDYVINAGGLIGGAQELRRGSLPQALKEAEAIYERLLGIFAKSGREGLPPHRAADLIVEAKLAQARSVLRDQPRPDVDSLSV